MYHICTVCRWIDPSEASSDRCPSCDAPMEAVVAESAETEVDAVPELSRS